MSFKLNSMLAVAGLACAFALPTGLSAQQSTTPAPAPAGGAKQGMSMGQGEGGMQTTFPGLREAHMHLSAAQRALEKANYDYGDHKAKAMDLIKQAQQELEACKEYAQSHPQK